MRESKGLMGLTAPSLGYEGAVMVGPHRLMVRDGHLAIGGKQFFVSKDGQVTDADDRPVGQVQGGRLVPMQQQQQQQQQQAQQGAA